MLPPSGQIDMGKVRAEVATGGPVSLGDPLVRALAGVPDGDIALSDLYGKSGTPATGFTATPSGDEVAGPVTGATFIASAFPSVVEASGTPPYAHQWSIAVQSDAGFTLSNADQATCEVTHRIGKYGYVGQCSLTCVSSDATGQQVTNTGVVASFNFQQDIPV